MIRGSTLGTVVELTGRLIARVGNIETVGFLIQETIITAVFPEG